MDITARTDHARGGSSWDGAVPYGDAMETSDLDAWRWQNYTDHLRDLGYDLGGGSTDGEDARSRLR